MSAAVTTAGSSARATAVEPVTSTTSAPFSWSEDEPAPSNAATGTTNLGGPRRSLPGSLLNWAAAGGRPRRGRGLFLAPPGGGWEAYPDLVAPGGVGGPAARAS